MLVGLARNYPKIAVGGMARLRGRRKRWFAEQCFARVWPKAVHGLAVPWHSTDASNWELNAAKFGRWKAFGGRNIGIRGGARDLRSEVAWYRQLEQLARHRWRREMEVLVG